MKKILILLFIISSCALPKKGGEINTHKVAGIENVAVKGYDVVAYFTEKKPVKGMSAYSYEWSDALWFFKNQTNLNKFKASPTKYAPQYGGYCAYGVSVPQQKIDIEADAWHIHNGKLYLNYTPATQNIWLEDKAGHIEAADEHWPTVKNQ